MREGERGSVFCHVLKTFKALCMFGIIQMQFEKLTSNLVWALMITASIYKIRASAEWLCLPLHQGNYYFYSSISKHYISVFLAKMAPPNLTVTNLSLMFFSGSWCYCNRLFWTYWFLEATFIPMYIFQLFFFFLNLH